MSSIVNRSKPSLTVKTERKVNLPCPNCSEEMTLNDSDVDNGNIVKCSACSKLTYYPFERSWFRNRKVILGLIGTVVLSIALGVAGNATYDFVKFRITRPSNRHSTDLSQ